MHDIIVISDLHLGRGRNPETGRYHNLEAFFYDEDLRRFCTYLCEEAQRREVPLRLIFNGDVFDLLRTSVGKGEGASLRERLFGTPVTPQAASQVVAGILAGHAMFVDGVAQVLEAGHEVIFLPGNHDVELQWEQVQLEVEQALIGRVRERAGDEAAAAAAKRLRFEPWFYYEPGRLWVEHGSQYDPENSFRCLLRRRLAEEVDAASLVELDVPLGTFFQRFLYNGFGNITFIVPSSRANLRYARWLMVNRPSLLARVAKSHGPFALQFVRRLARAAASGGVSGGDRLKQIQQVELDAIARKSGLEDKLRAIDGLKDTQHDVVQAVRTFSWQLVKASGVALLVVLLAVGLWFAGMNTINQLRLGLGPKALLFLALNLLFLVGTTAALGYWLFRAPPAESPAPQWRAAREIVRLLDVPIVSFGHTHDEAVWRLEREGGGKAWYFNTGTWIAVFTHDVLMPRERVQFTFLRVRGGEGELLHWSPGRREPLPVILLDDEGAPPTSS